MGKSKAIVLVASSFPFGGASANLLRYFTYSLKNAGHVVEVIMPTGAYYGKKLDQSSNRKGEINGIKYRRLGFIFHPKNTFGKLLDNILGLFLPFFFLLYRSLFKKLDLIIVYNPVATSMLFYLLSKVFLRKKLLVILPEYYEKPPAKIFSLRLFKWYNFFISIQHLVRHADLFIVLSRYLKKHLESRLKTPKDILIMPNLTDPERFTSVTANKFRAGYVTIGYVGTPTRKDGVLDLIDSFALVNNKYPKSHLLIIGDITNGQTIIPQLKEFALTKGIDLSKITFKGLTSHMEIPDLLLSCQILALTRPAGVFAEAGFPTKLGEYFACKKPVVVTRVGDMKSYFKDKEQVVFAEPENVLSIASAFEYLLNHQDKANEIGMNGYNWMDRNLNYMNQTQKILEFIK